MRFSLGLGTLVALSSFALGVPQAWADSPPPSASAYEGRAFPVCAKTNVGTESFDAHYTVGREAFEHSQHEEALKQFFMAYEADCRRHEILIIMSRAYEGAEHYADAARALEAYLTRAPDAQGAAAMRERIAKLREKHRAQADARAKEASLSPKTERPTVASPEASSSSPSSDRLEAPTHSMAPWIVVGAGGTLVVAGAITFTAAVLSLPSGCHFGFPSHCDDTRNNAEAERSRPATYVATAFAGVGILGIAAGLAWHFFEKSSAPSAVAQSPLKRAMLVPHVGAGYTGGSVVASF